MLIHKDLKGNAGGAEHTALGGLLSVGNEFMTDRNETSEVQRSGEFVTMTRREGGFVQLVTMFESADGRGPRGAILDDRQTYAQRDEKDPYGTKHRSRLLTAAFDTYAGEQDFETVARPMSRLPRFVQAQASHRDQRPEAIDYATKYGRRRLFSLGDGKLALVRELSDPDDTRYFMGVDLLGGSYRRSRVTGVELVKVDADTGSFQGVLFRFDVHSGLGFDPGSGSMFQPGYRVESARDDLGLYDATRIFTPRVGFMWGRRLGNAYLSADPSATYGIAEPALASDGGKDYMSIVAVHGLPANSPDLRTSLLTSLTCTYTVPGGVEHSRIVFPPYSSGAGRFYSARAIELVRVSPTNLVLRVDVTAQSINTGDAPQPGIAKAIYWSGDNGRSWALLDQSPLLLGSVEGSYPGPVMARGDGTGLMSVGMNRFGVSGMPASIPLFAVSAAGFVRVGEYLRSRMNEGLWQETTSSAFSPIPYHEVGASGGVRVDKKELLWVQLDPNWCELGIGRGGAPAQMLANPASRAMLLVSDDDGVTWTRRFLPADLPQNVGFCVGIDRNTLMVPVYGPRKLTDNDELKPVSVTFYVSKDGGVKWTKAKRKVTLPDAAFVDGWVLKGTVEYQLAEIANDINRGELFPVVSVRDIEGAPLPINPSRPWLADHKKTRPSNG